MNILIPLLAFVGLTLAERPTGPPIKKDSCEVQLAQYRGCVGKAKRESTDLKKEEKKSVRRESLKLERTTCLNMNGCFGKQKKDLQKKGENCEVCALKRIQRKLERCTRTDLTNVLYGKDGAKKKRARCGRKDKDKLKDLVSICINKAAAQKALKCLKAAKKKSKKEATTIRRNAKREKNAQKKALRTCNKELDRKCKKELVKDKKEVTSRLCSCAQKLSSDSTLAAELDSCEAFQLGAGSAAVAAAQEGATGNENGDTAMERLISRLCLEARLGNEGKPKGRSRKKGKKGRGKGRKTGKGGKRG
jgi:hypothetical protein